MPDILRKVILVEDNQAEARLATIAFSSHPDRPEIIHCPDGEHFLNLLNSLSLDEIAYVLLDLNMPKLNGIDVLKKIAENEQWSSIPIIVFTSSAFEQDVAACYKWGASAYVVKPVEFDELDQKLSAINSFWADTNRLPLLTTPA